MQKLTLDNSKSLDVYRTLALKPAMAQNLSLLDTINKRDGADQLVYKRGEDTYIAVGRGDLRGVKVGDSVNVDGDKLEVLYVSNKLNTKAEADNRTLLSAAIPGTLIGACAAGLGALIVGGPVAIAAGAIGGLVLGTLGVYAQMRMGLTGQPQSIWNSIR